MEEHNDISDPWSGFRQGIETIENNKAWHDKNYDQLKEWLQQNYAI